MTSAGRLPEPSEPQRRLDVSGELCPVPMVRARAELETMRPGQVLEVVATDPMAELDLAVMCERTAHRLLGARTDNGVLRVRIEAGQGSRPD